MLLITNLDLFKYSIIYNRVAICPENQHLQILYILSRLKIKIALTEKHVTGHSIHSSILINCLVFQQRQCQQ